MLYRIWDSMSYMWKVENEYFRSYMGTGLIVAWFLVSLVYLLITEKRKPVRILFVYTPIILLIAFFNPLLARVFYDYIGDEIYYRILWLLPITAVIAFAAVELYGKIQGYGKRALFAVTAAALIMVSGSCIYRNPNFHKAENLYHVPQSVVDICDAIEVEGREVKAVFPAELLQYVRQYSPVVVMPYGRDVTVERWNYTTVNPLYEAMEADRIDAERLAALVREEWCAYIVLPLDKEVDGSLEAYDFEVFGEMDGYIIYKDSTVSLEIPQEISAEGD